MSSKPYRISGENWVGMAVETPGGGFWYRKTFASYAVMWFHNRKLINRKDVPEHVYELLK